MGSPEHKMLKKNISPLYISVFPLKVKELARKKSNASSMLKNL